MNTNSNTALYATRGARYPILAIASGTAANTVSGALCAGDATYGSLISDILFRSFEASVARVFDIIICAPGSEAAATSVVATVTIPALSGTNGSTAMASLAALAPQLFDIDLAGNRVFALEAGQSVFLKNLSLTAGIIHARSKVRDFTP